MGETHLDNDINIPGVINIFIDMTCCRVFTIRLLGYNGRIGVRGG